VVKIGHLPHENVFWFPRGRSDLERSNFNKSAYNHKLYGICPYISTYKRSMSKKTLDMH
jgi:hypothetical protein